MTPSATDATWIKGKRVAFTGRLASLTRAEAVALLASFGAEHVTAVNQQTDLLVVGQEGWPLRSDGGWTLNLKKAHKLQQAGAELIILPEDEWFTRLGLDAHAHGVHRLYTTAEVCRTLQVARDRIRSWVRAGLVRPVETVRGVNYFDFQQVSGVRSLCRLAQAGVTPDRLRRSLEQLRNWMPALDPSLSQLKLIERDGQLLIRLEDGQLVEPTGQLHFDFSDDSPPNVVDVKPSMQTAEQCFSLGREHEEAGRLHEAAEAYREALRLGGPDAAGCFNLANVLYSLDDKGPAAERFRQAVEIDPGFWQAWNNLGNVLGELEQHAEAVASYRKALELNPDYADAHYNLADTLEQLGRAREARAYWEGYLRRESRGPWADHARSRLERMPAG
jgi:tetratricopeptide (TPR) repeat protein